MDQRIVWKRLWARKYAPFMGAGFVQGFVKPRGFSLCKNKLFVPEGNLYAMYFAEDEFNKFMKNYTSFLMKTDLSRYAKQYEKNFSIFLNHAKKISRINFLRLSNQDLVVLLTKLNKWLVECGEWQLLVWFVVEGVGAELEKLFARRTDGAELLSAVSTPPKMTRMVKARLELWRLKKSAKAHENVLEKYAKKYAWFPVYEFIDKPWATKDFSKQVKSIKDAAGELKVYKTDRRVQLKKYNNLLKTVKDKRLKKMIKIVHIFAYLKEMRDDYRRPAYYLLQPFWKEIAKRTRLTFEQTNYLLVEELEQILRTGRNPYREEIRARQKKYAIWLQNGKLHIYSGAKAEKIAKMFEGPRKRSLSGMVAYPGKVRGKVKIVLHQSEFQKFEKGEVLVTVMTHPEFVPIMKQAVAIITNEGGITCHAAIISRELKTPCIIGTKIATQVLKDGDLVEVDANKGIVKKLS